ncbi:MAG: metallophosphoesterase [Candidatus Eremiobacteraeota bacterium]|nr:metallophosphoesterase [Candidatus Eremiobacteraeota bacterium]
MRRLLIILILIITSASIAHPFSEDKSHGGIYCRVDGAIIQKMKPDIIVSKLIQPTAEFYIKNRGRAKSKIRLKIININPSFAYIKSGKGKNVRILYAVENYAMLEVNIPAGKSARFTISYKSNNPEKFTFALVGDPQGNMKIFSGMLAEIKKKKPLFIIVMGDLVERGTSREYSEYLKTISGFPIPIYHIPGNHDITDGGRSRFLWDVSPADYSFDVGKFHFTMLDSSRWYLRKNQWRWLEGELKKHSNCFVFMHVPPFSPIKRFDEYTLAYKGQKKRFLSVMKRHKVRSVFSGHVHGFQKEVRDGVQYYVSGGGGAKLHLFPWNGGYYNFLIVDVDDMKFRVSVVKYQ